MKNHDTNKFWDFLRRDERDHIDSINKQFDELHNSRVQVKEKLNKESQPKDEDTESIELSDISLEEDRYNNLQSNAR